METLVRVDVPEESDQVDNQAAPPLVWKVDVR